VRLFVAVQPPRPVIEHLQEAVARARTSAGPTADELRWTPVEQWHLTMVFLGEVDEAALPDLRRRLARAAGRHSSEELCFRGAGTFGGASRARVLWVGVHGQRAELRALAGSVGAAVRRTGIDIEDRPYRPHLTVARSRARTGTDVRALVTDLEAYEGPAWTVESIALVRSHLGRGGARHEPLTSWQLR
jgi:RNA 2',3'-cyclic 3'-phosphodiesterase